MDIVKFFRAPWHLEAPLLLASCALLLVCIFSYSSPATASSRFALVVGNSSYPESPLRNPTNDADDISEKLSELGFAVTKVTDADQKGMERAIRTFGRKLHEDSVALFYYAGHGLQVDGNNYLVPVDADIELEDDVKYETVNLGRITDAMGRSGSGLNLIVLDACRNNPYSRSFRSTNRGLARVSPASGTIIMYATEPGKVAADGTERNGVFTQELLKLIDKPKLPIETLFKRVAQNVATLTSGAQRPWSEGNLLGEFSFNSKSAKQHRVPAVASNQVAVTEVRAAPATQTRSANPTELYLWQSAERGNSIGEYEAYLSTFPNGSFSSMARAKISKLEQSQPTPTVTSKPTIVTAHVSSNTVVPTQPKPTVVKKAAPPAPAPIQQPAHTGIYRGENANVAVTLKFENGKIFMEDGLVRRPSRGEIQCRGGKLRGSGKRIKSTTCATTSSAEVPSIMLWGKFPKLNYRYYDHSTHSGSVTLTRQ